MNKERHAAVPSVGTCSNCEHPLVHRVTTLDRPYKNVMLRLHGFKVRVCLTCGEESYSAASLIRFGEAAIEHYLKTGELDYTCRYKN
ncbi:YgiT-type zinc finger protein [Cohnella soli]|uniref:YgiT-type zinc finger protein n=1 Tax=Cohnella soli TaxID=425005 RepID=A0ABW0HN71_9BACL